MMADSLESRKFERKQLFDVPLPVRPKNRDPSAPMAPGEEGPARIPSTTMAFSLLTKKGNRQQVRPPPRAVIPLITFADMNFRPGRWNCHPIRRLPSP